MGKGTIISGGSDGQYSVVSVYDRTAYTARIAALTAGISALDDQIAETDPGLDQDVLKVQKFSLEKNKSYLEDNMPDDETISAWCADLTEDLSGDVGLIEVPGESVAFNIQPGYNANAVYDIERDGQLVPTIIQTPEQAFYNLAMLPGWQKWQPTFRYATITSITDDVADITMESAISTQQGLDVNQGATLENVAIDYMDCNGSAFLVGDSVLVMFTGQDWAAPKIIGFKDNPQPCGGHLYISFLSDCIVWDLETSAYSENIPLNAGGIATFPTSEASISDWKNNFTETGYKPAKKTTNSNPDDPIFTDCTTLFDYYTQGPPAPSCHIYVYTYDCEVPVFSPEYLATYTGDRTEYQSSSEDFFKYTIDTVNFYPFGTSNGVQMFTATSLTNTGGDVIGGNAETHELAVDSEDRYFDDPAVQGACANPGWYGQTETQDSTRTVVCEAPFSDPFSESVDTVGEIVQTVTREVIGGDPIECDISYSGERFRTNLKRVGGVCSDEIDGGSLVSWYYWKLGKRGESNSCYEGEKCSGDLPISCSDPLIYDTEEILFEQFQVFSETTESNPSDLNPFTIGIDTPLTTAVAGLLAGADPAASLAMTFLE